MRSRRRSLSPPRREAGRLSHGPASLLGLFLIGLFLIACSSKPATPRAPDAATALDARTDDARDAGSEDAPDGAPIDGPAGAEVAVDAIADAGAEAPLVDAPLPPSLGRWTTGDLHVHTIQSNDAQTPQSLLSVVLEAAFARHRLDWITLSNHLRVSDRDAAGNTLPNGPLPLSKALALHEVPAVSALQNAGTYADKTIFSSVEWDMPTHEHFNIGILSPEPGSRPALAAINQFEYLFTNRDVAMFDPADVARWGPVRRHTTHADAVQAIAWLAQNHPETSYGLIAHPTRYPDRYEIAHFRELNDLAPKVVFTIEGIVGNQMEPDRGGYASEHVEANAHARTYGGADSVIAKVGGVWDALLGEGRRMWAVGNSDYHFKTAGDQFSSGYLPGEYAKNHVWVEGDGMLAILHGLRAGKAFTATGNLISALDFTASGGTGAPAQMGGQLQAPRGGSVTIKIRWKSELPSAYETPVGSGKVPGAIPVVDHVDLIAGDVAAQAAPGTPAYDVATNPSTRVLARFTGAHWTTDADGYKTVTYNVTATKDEYFRLRGTNLGVDVAGETQAGEPLPDAKTTVADHVARFNAINDRNYADLWFYSNPIFLHVE